MIAFLAAYLVPGLWFGWMLAHHMPTMIDAQAEATPVPTPILRLCAAVVILGVIVLWPVQCCVWVTGWLAGPDEVRK